MAIVMQDLTNAQCNIVVDRNAQCALALLSVTIGAKLGDPQMDHLKVLLNITDDDDFPAVFKESAVMHLSIAQHTIIQDCAKVVATDLDVMEGMFSSRNIIEFCTQ